MMGRTKIFTILLIIIMIVNCSHKEEEIIFKKEITKNNIRKNYKNEVEDFKNFVLKDTDITNLIPYNVYSIIKINIRKVINEKNLIKELKEKKQNFLVNVFNQYIKQTKTQEKDLRNIYFFISKKEEIIDFNNPIIILDIEYKRQNIKDFLLTINIKGKTKTYNNCEYIEIDKNNLYMSNGYIAIGESSKILDLIDIEKGLKKNFTQNPFYKKNYKKLNNNKLITFITQIQGPMFNIIENYIPGVNLESSYLIYLEIDKRLDIWSGKIDIFSTDPDTNRRNFNNLELNKHYAKYIDKEIYSIIKNAQFYYDEKMYGVKF